MYYYSLKRRALQRAPLSVPFLGPLLDTDTSTEGVFGWKASLLFLIGKVGWLLVERCGGNKLFMTGPAKYFINLRVKY